MFMILYIVSGSLGATVRRCGSYEDVWPGTNQCQSSRLSTQQKVLWQEVISPTLASTYFLMILLWYPNIDLGNYFQFVRGRIRVLFITKWWNWFLVWILDVMSVLCSNSGGGRKGSCFHGILRSLVLFILLPSLSFILFVCKSSFLCSPNYCMPCFEICIPCSH